MIQVIFLYLINSQQQNWSWFQSDERFSPVKQYALFLCSKFNLLYPAALSYFMRRYQRQDRVTNFQNLIQQFRLDTLNCYPRDTIKTAILHYCTVFSNSQPLWERACEEALVLTHTAESGENTLMLHDLQNLVLFETVFAT